MEPQTASWDEIYPGYDNDSEHRAETQDCSVDTEENPEAAETREYLRSLYKEA